MKRKNEMKLSEALEYFIERAGMKEKIQVLEVRETWNQIVGEWIDRQTSSIEITENKGIIFLSSPLLVSDFNYKKESFLKKLNEQLKSIQLENLEFKVGNKGLTSEP